MILWMMMKIYGVEATAQDYLENRIYWKCSKWYNMYNLYLVPELYIDVPSYFKSLWIQRHKDWSGRAINIS